MSNSRIVNFFSSFVETIHSPMNRFDRVSAILIMLQTKHYVTAEEVALRYGVSKRTIYRDLKTLEEAGVPVGAEPGKGYYLVDGYHLPPVMFTRDEAAALTIAGKVVEKFTDVSTRKEMHSALDKIKAVLPIAAKELAVNMEKDVEVFYATPSPDTDYPNNFLIDLHQALASHLPVAIDYHAQGSGAVVCGREVEPIAVCFYSLCWHLIGWCRLRSDYRDFRLDRIKRLSVLTEPFKLREITSARQYFSHKLQHANMQEVVVRVDRLVAPLLTSTRHYYGFVEEVAYPNYIEMVFVTNDISYIGRWFLMFAESVDVVSPNTLVDFLRAKIDLAKERISKTC